MNLLWCALKHSIPSNNFERPNFNICFKFVWFVFFSRFRFLLHFDCQPQTVLFPLRVFLFLLLHAIKEIILCDWVTKKFVALELRESDTFSIKIILTQIFECLRIKKNNRKENRLPNKHFH